MKVRKILENLGKKKIMTIKEKREKFRNIRENFEILLKIGENCGKTENTEGNRAKFRSFGEKLEEI